MHKPIKILIVEDEAIIALYLETVLCSAGYTVTATAVSGEQALQCVTADRPDLALMDVNLLGGMDGIEVADYLDEHYGIPAIYMSAYTPEQLRDRVNPNKPFRYLPKHVHQKDLIHAIEDAIT
jgi:CheY-like chemotaxis protein